MGSFSRRCVNINSLIHVNITNCVFQYKSLNVGFKNLKLRVGCIRHLFLQPTFRSVLSHAEVSTYIEDRFGRGGVQADTVIFTFLQTAITGPVTVSQLKFLACGEFREYTPLILQKKLSSLEVGTTGKSGVVNVIHICP